MIKHQTFIWLSKTAGIFAIVIALILASVSPVMAAGKESVTNENENNTIEFVSAGDYIPRIPVATAPEFSWNPFLGGSGPDMGLGIAMDGDGSIYISGYSGATWGSPVREFSGSSDAFVAKLDRGSNLIWNTFLGGTNDNSGDSGHAIAVDIHGNVYVTGQSLATWGSPVREFSGSGDAFVAKLDSSGNLIWHTFLGGSGLDDVWDIAVTAIGNVYLAGESHATWGSPVQAYYNETGDVDGFAAMLNSSGNLVWNTFLGGGGDDYGWGIAADGSGNVYINGESSATWGSPVRAYTGDNDAFIAKIDSSGSLIWNTFLGANGWDRGYGLAVDSENNVFLTGRSYATWGSPVQAYTSNNDAFVAKLDNSGSLIWNTFLGENGYDQGRDVAVDGNGNVYIGGVSGNTWGAPVRAYTSYNDAFVAKLDNNGSLIWNTFLGGNGYEEAWHLVMDSIGNVYISGYSDAAWGSPLREYSGSGDAFAAKVDSGGNLVILKPAIRVEGNGVEIANWDTTPTVDDDTDFGSADIVTGVVERTFTINNNGDGVLLLTGTPLVVISGYGAADFKISTPPSSSVAAGGSTSFMVTFDPGTAGQTKATLSIANDDSDENPFVFDIQGIGTSALTVSGITAMDKEYDGNSIATIITEGALMTDGMGSVVDESSGVSLEDELVTSTFIDKNTGVNKTVAISGLYISGPGSIYYTLSQPGATADITPRAITVTAVTDTKAYDGTTNSDGLPVITVGELAEGDNADWTQVFDSPLIGTNKTLIPSGTISDGNNGDNYLVTFININTGTITATPGDANEDGAVNALDITKVERIIAGLDAPTAGADANQDGNINALDITKTERIIAGLG